MHDAVGKTFFAEYFLAAGVVLLAPVMLTISRQRYIFFPIKYKDMYILFAADAVPGNIYQAAQWPGCSVRRGRSVPLRNKKAPPRRGKALDSIPSSFSEGDGQTAVLLEGVGHERGVGHRADNAVGRIVRRERCLSGIYRNCKRTGDVMTVLVEDVDGDIIRFVV